jgi:non-canonical purine NTP pyrophosphatase (RdgB/HAM1 family)
MAEEKKVYFITGNADKARYLSKFLDIKIIHKKIELEEIQSLNLQKIVQKKLKEAYKIVQAPVLVEDVSLGFEALGGLPGPFIKFFLDNMKLVDVCDLIKGKERGAVARCVFGYFDGKSEKYFEGQLQGRIAEVPRGKGGYGWDQIFIPIGYNNKTRAELNEKEDQETYLKIKPLGKIKKYLEKLK